MNLTQESTGCIAPAELLGRIVMAETESASQGPTVPEVPSNGGDQRPSIALSEENLAALLGLSTISPKSGSQNGGSLEVPATPAAAENVESALASLAAVQENRAEH